MRKITRVPRHVRTGVRIIVERSSGSPGEQPKQQFEIQRREKTRHRKWICFAYTTAKVGQVSSTWRERKRERENIIDYPYSCPCCVLSEEANLVLFSLLLATSVRPKLQSHVATRSSGMVAFRLEKAAVHTRNRHEFRARRRRRRFSKSATLKMRTSNL